MKPSIPLVALFFVQFSGVPASPNIGRLRNLTVACQNEMKGFLGSSVQLMGTLWFADRINNEEFRKDDTLTEKQKTFMEKSRSKSIFLRDQVSAYIQLEVVIVPTRQKLFSDTANEISKLLRQAKQESQPAVVDERLQNAIEAADKLRKDMIEMFKVCRLVGMTIHWE